MELDSQERHSVGDTGMHRRIYLADFDLDESGRVGYLARAYPLAALNLYALLFDQVVLQSSAFGKVPALEAMLLGDESLFQGSASDCAPVSMYLEEGYESYAHYFEVRREFGLRGRTAGNAEYEAYMRNGAFGKAPMLDDIVSGESVVRTPVSVDELFRRELLARSEGFNWSAEGSGYGAYVGAYARLSDRFQTFDLENRLARMGCPRGLRLQFSKTLRACYYHANASACGDNLSSWRKSFSVALAYSGSALSLTLPKLNRMRAGMLRQIRELSETRVLVDLYHEIGSEGALERLLLWIDSGFSLRHARTASLALPAGFAPGLVKWCCRRLGGIAKGV